MRRLALVTAVVVVGWGGTAQAASWQIVPSPNQASGDDQLVAVSASSPTDVWAAGDTLMRWNGASWHLMKRPLKAQPIGSLLVLTPTDVWAGLAGGSKDMLHWDGVTWQPSTVPGLGGTIALSGLSPGDVWALGHGKHAGCAISHWDGGSWQTASLASICGVGAGLADVLEATPTSVWVAGYDDADPFQPLIGHWDGKSWTRAWAPTLAGSVYATSLAGSHGQIWAAGAGQLPGQATQPWVADVVGQTSHGFPRGRYNRSFDDIATSSPTSVWAVGQRTVGSGDQRSFTAHFDGAGWSVIASPNPIGSRYVALWQTTVVPGSADDVWAVGTFYSRSLNRLQTLTLHWQ